MENNCNYVCSIGILKSCNIHSQNPISSIKQLNNYDFSNINAGSTIYICASAIPHFVQIFSQISCKFVLITGDCDETVPVDLFTSNEDFLNFINSDKIIHWFAQNCTTNHPKLTRIPIGLDYHTLARQTHEWGAQMQPLIQEKLLMTIAKEAAPFYEREIKAYGNFQFQMKTKFAQDRLDALNQFPAELSFYEPFKNRRADAWTNQSKYAFVLSPHGNGLDCHRTWEALTLGCIPIVKTSKIDSLYDDLPVLIVNSWLDVTPELLNMTVNEFKIKKFNYDKLTLKYWINQFKY